MNFWVPLGVEHEGDAVYANLVTGDLCIERDTCYLVSLEPDVARAIARKVAQRRELEQVRCSYRQE